MKTKLLMLTLCACILQAQTDQDKNSVNNKVPANTKTASLVNANTSTAWVDQKVEEIKPQRRGLSSSSLATLKSPFIVIRKKPKEGSSTKQGPSIAKSTSSTKELVPTKKDMSKEPLTLQIVLNSSALINGKWLKTNDLFRGYKLTQIQKDYVVLERRTKKIKLFIAQKSNNINISTK